MLSFPALLTTSTFGDLQSTFRYPRLGSSSHCTVASAVLDKFMKFLDVNTDKLLLPGYKAWASCPRQKSTVLPGQQSVSSDTSASLTSWVVECTSFPMPQEPWT